MPAVDTDALSRSRWPICGSFAWVADDAEWVAGQVNPVRVFGTVIRIAWSMRPAATSSYRTRPAKIDSPDASADVQPAGRSLSERRSKIAPEPAFQPPPCGKAENSS